MESPHKDDPGPFDAGGPGATPAPSGPDARQGHTHFDLPADRVNDWHARGALITHFLNTFSVMAPAFERFIVCSARHYQPMIESARLKEQLASMLIQEAMHLREHKRYNQLIEESGLSGKVLERRAGRLLEACLNPRWTTPPFRLAVALMLEHHTALASRVTLNNPALLNGSVNGYAKLWIWHAREETEHRSVTYDLWTHVMGQGLKPYLLRVGAAMLVGPPALLLAMAIFARMLLADHERRIDARAIWMFFKSVYGPGGLIPGSAKPWLMYFMPGFHPRKYSTTAF